MERIATRLGGRADYCSGSLPKLRVEARGHNLGLSDRIKSRVDDDDTEERITVVSAIENVRSSPEMLPVYGDLNTALRVLARGMLPIETLRPSRGESQLSEVAIVNRSP